ncbi:aldo/keto reductase [Streptomyces milbemycinicus]|uniref:Aldo/keto reductase n=1 Tax=Streptomyces milbemycinicus TaxID=476552 RepID=A0ABW8LRL1_9ACTN
MRSAASRIAVTVRSASRLVLGTMNFGSRTSEEDSGAIMDHAHEHGINFFDTANSYGAQQGEGLTDYIDLYQMHHIDRDTPWEEIWEAFSVLRQQGKVLYFGSSNFAGWHIALAQEAARSRHFLGLVSEQSIYNLMSRWAELEVLPAARHYGLGVIPWSPLHGGVLSGVLRKQREGLTGRSGSGLWAAAFAEQREAVEAYEKLCAELGEDPAHVGLAWLLAQDGVTGPIVGPRTVEQLDGTLRALEITLDHDTLAKLDETFPPPAPNGAKPAPEAYAW